MDIQPLFEKAASRPLEPCTSGGDEIADEGDSIDGDHLETTGLVGQDGVAYEGHLEAGITGDVNGGCSKNTDGKDGTRSAHSDAHSADHTADHGGWDGTSAKGTRGGDRTAVGEGCEGVELDNIPDVVVEHAVTPIPHTASKVKTKKEKRRDEHKAAKRACKRAEKQQAAGTSLKAIAIRRAAESKALRAKGYDIVNAPHASTGYIGKWAGATRVSREGQSNSESAVQLERLRRQGFQMIPWDGNGIYVLDGARRAIVGGGTPQDCAGWSAVVEGAVAALIRAGNTCSFTEKQRSHRRGKFPALAAGFEYGLGQMHPATTSQTADNKEPVQDLLSDPYIRRLAGVQSTLFRAYAPRLWDYYDRTIDTITASQPDIQRNFSNSVFASITFNFGPQTVTLPHVDYLNLAGGLCAITALGSFDPDLGGHLILWDLRIVLRFPPGATILIPSSLLRHSNVPIQSGEQRYSITQYSAGGLFRWVGNGLCSNATLRGQGGAGEGRQEQWQNIMDLFERK